MATKKRVSITIDAEALRLADGAARRGKTSRSEFIRKAVRRLAESQELSGDAAQPERRRRAIDGITDLAHHFGDWPAEQILRAGRDRSQKPKR
jgi:metal-responsive CopG/Arc/MetJ family transcriptional regulator